MVQKLKNHKNRDDSLLFSWAQFSDNFSGFRRFRSDATTAKQMKIDQYCQRQRCKHVELGAILAYFRVAWVCQRQLGFFVGFGMDAFFRNPFTRTRARKRSQH